MQDNFQSKTGYGQNNTKIGDEKRMEQVNIRCPYCGSRAFLRPAWVVHKEKTEDPEARLYVCARYPACNSYVSAHKGTHLPMGTLASPDLRRKRIEAHEAMSRVMADRGMTRKQTYRWLQHQLGLPEVETHIGRFTEFRCRQVVALCDSFTHSAGRAA